ncbi:hypothetical protein [Streptomyces sp. NPDC046887]|uniref:hypothetical protein n=1 Tax=Streptomyces sp. NPDC046887 TaxID=3155472 RepID=UPI0033F0C488
MLTVAALTTGVLYAWGLPPFERRAEITAGEVCAPFGDASNALPALDTVLPDRPEYSFSRSGNGPRSVGGSWVGYRLGCDVRSADGSVLLYSTAEFTDYEPARQDWIDEVLIHGSDDTQTFTAGTLAVVGDGQAAVNVPCLSTKQAALGPQGLQVGVYLREYERPASAALRQSLADLAVSAAHYAHRDARCDLPSKLPDSAPRLTRSN